MARVSAVENVYDYLIGVGFSPETSIFDDMVFSIMARSFEAGNEGKELPVIIAELDCDRTPEMVALDLLEEARRKGIKQPLEAILAEACKVCEEGKAVPFA